MGGFNVRMKLISARMPPLDECPPNTRRVGTCYPPYYKCNLGVCIPIVPNGYGVCCKGRKLIFTLFISSINFSFFD